MADENGSPPTDGGPSDIRPVSITEEMKKSYLDYAMSVIVARALPDARDGLKPVHRRILYSMHENGYEWNKPYRKAARVVGDRSLDLPNPLRGLIAGKMEKSGVSPLRTAKIREFVPVGRSDRASLYDESLPPGLVLGSDVGG